MWNVIAGCVDESKEITSAVVVSPTPFSVGLGRRNHHGPNVGDGATRVVLIGIETDTFSPGPESALVPELVVSPTDQTELRMGSCRKPAPVAVND